MKSALNYRKIEKFVKTSSKLFKDLIYYRNIDSTNLEALRIYKKYKNNFIIIADSQSAGRGRFKRKWVSPFGENLYLSLVIKNRLLTPNHFLIMLVSNSIVKTLKRYNIDGLIKWPNDIIVYDKKISGILIEENYSADKKVCIVIGMGLNVNSNFDYNRELKDTATSIYQTLNKQVEREEVFEIFLKNFENEFEKDENEIYKFYIEHIYLKNREIEFENEGNIFKGILTNIDREGNIVLKIGDEFFKFNSGEIISLR